jgi:hypothetical protein
MKPSESFIVKSTKQFKEELADRDKELSDISKITYNGKESERSENRVEDPNENQTNAMIALKEFKNKPPYFLFV